MNETRQPKLAENLCRMNYERSSRRKKWRIRRRLRFTMRDLLWLVFCTALGTIIWMDNAHYRREVDQIQFEANQARDVAMQKLEEVEAREAFLKVREQGLEVKAKGLEVKEKQWQERLGRLTTQTPR